MAYPLQPRPAPGRPSADRLQGGEDWTPIRGQHSEPIDSGFIDEDLEVGQEGTEVTALWLNMTQEEIVKVIEAAGLVVNPADWTQLYQALQIMGLSFGSRSRRWTSVISKSLSSAPGAPVAGDTYLIPTGATGIWAAAVGSLAEWNGSAWAYTTPPDGHGISLPDGRVFERIAGVYVEKIALDVQSGKWGYAVAAGTANAATATLSPVPASIPEGMEICLKFTTPNTNAATLNVNGLGNIPVVKSDGAPLIGGELSGMVELRYSGTAWQIMSVNASARVVLTADTTLYVNASTGNDANAGTLAAPFQTLQKAWDFVQQKLDLGGKNVTISCAGAFTAGVVASGGCVGSASPTAVTFAGTGGATVAVAGASCFTALFGASFRLSGLTLSASGAGNCISCSQGQVTIGAGMVFGSCSQTHISVTSGGVVNVTNSYSISGGASAHYQAAIGYVFLQTGVTVTLTGTPAFSNAFAVFFQLGVFSVGGGASFVGAATGFRYSVTLNGVINTNGGGANFFPGSGAGIAGTGGQYA